MTGWIIQFLVNLFSVALGVWLGYFLTLKWLDWRQTRYNKNFERKQG